MYVVGPRRARHAVPERCRSHTRDITADPAWVIGLDCPQATDPSLAGAKAATVAAVLQAGLPVLGGFVITTAASAAVVGGTALPADHRAGTIGPAQVVGP